MRVETRLEWKRHPQGLKLSVTTLRAGQVMTTIDMAFPRSEAEVMVRNICKAAGFPEPWQGR